MILLDHSLADLVAGYDRICDADQHLLSRWRPRLLAAYARKRDAFKAAQAEHRRRMARLTPMAVAGLILFGAMLVAGVVVQSPEALGGDWLETDSGLCCLGCLLVPAALAGMGVSGGLWLWKATIAAPRPPQHPLRSRLKARFFPPLLPRWLKELAVSLPTDLPYEGARGEHAFVMSLQRIEADTSYILYRLQQRPGDDVDVVVVGPKGIWLFEVKYWSGRIAWRDGQWIHQKSYYLPGGRPVTETIHVAQAPDQQWRRMAGDVAETLRRHAFRSLALSSDFSRIRGGVVFTHPTAALDIARDAPFGVGEMSGWVRRLKEAPDLPGGMSQRVAFQILDALLKRHREVARSSWVYSMDAYARRIIRETEDRLEQWAQAIAQPFHHG